jgi:hypothetical protein
VLSGLAIPLTTKVRSESSDPNRIAHTSERGALYTRHLWGSYAMEVLPDLPDPERTTRATERGALRTRHLSGPFMPQGCYVIPSAPTEPPAPMRDALFALTISPALPCY